MRRSQTASDAAQPSSRPSIVESGSWRTASSLDGRTGSVVPSQEGTADGPEGTLLTHPCNTWVNQQENRLPDTKNAHWVLSDIGTISAHFDWFRIIGKGHHDRVREIFESWFTIDSEPYAAHGYESVEFADHQAQLKLRNHRNPLSWLVELPGACIHENRSNIREITCSLLSLPHGQITRLDAAVDIRHPENRHQWKQQAKELVPLLRPSGKFIDTHPEGWTAYYGSPKSDKFVRFYDKGAETCTKGNWWFRYEAQFNRKLAPNYKKALLNETDWDELAHRIASGCLPELNEHAPDLRRLLGEPLTYTNEAKETDWEGFKAHAQNSVFRKVQMIAQHFNISPWEVLRQMDLDDLPATKTKGYHSGLFSSTPWSKDYIMGSNE